MSISKFFINLSMNTLIVGMLSISYGAEKDSAHAFGADATPFASGRRFTADDDDARSVLSMRSDATISYRPARFQRPAITASTTSDELCRLLLEAWNRIDLDERRASETNKRVGDYLSAQIRVLSTIPEAVVSATGVRQERSRDVLARAILKVVELYGGLTRELQINKDELETLRTHTRSTSAAPVAVAAADSRVSGLESLLRNSREAEAKASSRVGELEREVATLKSQAAKPAAAAEAKPATTDAAAIRKARAEGARKWKTVAGGLGAVVVVLVGILAKTNGKSILAWFGY
jgi:hypothetical protein